MPDLLRREARMTLIVFDPRTGKQTTITLPEPAETP
jgi:hypothetical protein